MAKSSAGQSVLTRVMRVLEAFEKETHVLTASQIARRADLSVPTAHRLVAELVKLGLLERDSDHRVRVGVRLWEIAARAPRALGLREAAMPFMEDLHAATRQHTQLGVLAGKEVLFIERLSARNAVINVTEIGGRLPVHASSGGLVLLAHSDRVLQEEVMESPLRRYTRNTPTNPRRLRELLAAIRAHGYVICDGFIHPDAMGIAVPVHGADNSVVAALAVVVPSKDSQPMMHVPALIAAARGITRAMGATPQPRR
ncbi:MAG: IclR family transcriptional regulator [Haloechinothrix sp.]